MKSKSGNNLLSLVELNKLQKKSDPPFFRKEPLGSSDESEDERLIEWLNRRRAEELQTFKRKVLKRE